VFFSEDHGDHQPSFDPLDLRVMVRMGDVESLDESYQEYLHLDDTTQELDLSIPRESE